METKEIKITAPKGFEIDKVNSTFEKIVFKEIKKDVLERIKTFKDVLSDLGENDEEVKTYQKLISANVTGKTLAFQQCVLISKCLNEGWISNWDNSNEDKYFVYFDMRNKGSFGGGCGLWRGAYAGSLAALCFKTSELAKYAGKKFEDIYRTYFKG